MCPWRFPLLARSVSFSFANFRRWAPRVAVGGLAMAAMAGSVNIAMPSRIKNENENGYGSVQFQDGSVYQGQLKEGRRHGQGTFVYANGSCYNGEWRDDAEHGQGRFAGSDGECYEGEFQEGTRSGRGCAIFADGRIFIGEFKEDRLLADQGRFLKSRDLSGEIGELANKICESFHKKNLTECERKAQVQAWAADAALEIRAMLGQARDKHLPRCEWLANVLPEVTNLDDLRPQGIRPTIGILERFFRGNQRRETVDDARVLLGAASVYEETFRRAVDTLLESKDIPRQQRHFGPPKTEERVLEKLRENQSPLSIFDLNRVEIACHNEREMRDVMVNMFKLGKIVRAKNKFIGDCTEPPCILYNIELTGLPPDSRGLLTDPTRWVVEVQLSLPEFLKIKSQIHGVYEISRRQDKLPDRCPVCQGYPPK